MENKDDKLEKAPNSLIFISLASMYLDNGMVDEAIDLCKSGLEIEPENEQAHLILAKALVEKGDREGAQKHLTELLQKDPANVSARELLQQITNGIEQLVKEEKKEKEFEVVDEKETLEEIEKQLPDKIDGSIAAVEEHVLDNGKVVEALEKVGDLPQELLAEVQREGIAEEDSDFGFKHVEDMPAEDDEIAEGLIGGVETTKRMISDESFELSEEQLEEIGRPFHEKMGKILKIKGVVSCFFRLHDGIIIKNPELIGEVDDLIPLLDTLIGALKSASDQLEMGGFELAMIEIEKGVFYIFEKKGYDCFVIARDANNFGLLRIMLPRILEGLTMNKEV